VTASAGISVYPTDGLDGATLLRKADFALLHAKAQRLAWPPLAMLAATVSHAAAKASHVEQAPGDISSPDDPSETVRRTP
jgi:predicted signal transduction protein with EAL and GGDEF domain